ncbi:hypothetical protein N7474_003494 [Penicillium riverlandense]|uniref:uncharacterized protein n=1 Tax=Penicillium riverlandense TaxID=1903569 RepID=UPI002548EFB7|nr:uncharacterized protein N7474_003494 [Penicillium riverlandense]KAJ5826356.1 hypothetical protein N7474_003494 [Penicillium riverlandense]
MSWNKSGGRRLPQPRDLRSQQPDVSFPAPSGIPTPGITYTGRGPRSQIARPVNYMSRTPSKGSSLSDTEDGGQITALPPTSKQIPNRPNRQSLLPRPNAGRSLSSTSPVSSVSLPNHNERIPTSLSTPEVNNPFASVIRPQPSTPKRPRNVLRRKAATIGKHTEQSQSQKLSLVIPQDSRPEETAQSSYTPFSESQTPTLYRPAYLPEQKNEAKMGEQGPAELASLRTTVDTQNLPPAPTPFFPSASTPSTRYSESPGMWSRTSTPTTLSSYSPGIVQSAKAGRLRQPSPSQTRMPFLSPSTSYASPQSDRASPVIQKPTTPANSSGPSLKSVSTKIRGPPCSPPPRKSSVNFSPPQKSDINVEQARREVEEAEKSLYQPQTATPAVPHSAPETPLTPPRPSRDGTDRLTLHRTPVIQSNLPYVRSTGHTRRESAEKVMTAEQLKTHPTPNRSAAASTDSVQSRSLSRIPTRETAPPVLSRKSHRTLTKEPPKEKAPPKMADTPKRFGLFSKRSKAELNDIASEQSRPARKGPAAGTGHEGYGKYSQRGRKSSVNSSGTRARSTSTTARSVASSKGSASSHPELDIDDFLMARLEPVIISGGGMDGAALSRTQSEQSMSSASVSSTSNMPRHTPVTSSAQSTDSLPTSIGTFEAPSESGLGLIYSQAKSLARRPSISDNQKPAAEQPTDYAREEAKEGKKSKTSRWNLFQRNRGNEQKSLVSTVPASHTAQLHASISPVANTRPVAHYAMVDTDSDELEDIMKKIEDSPPTEEEYLQHVAVPAGLNIQKKPSILLRSPPKLHGEFQSDYHASPKTAMFNRNLVGPNPDESPEDNRPSRLASVGRIPQVVSRRDRSHRPAVDSFSRPFSVVDLPNLMAPVTEDLHNLPPANIPPSNVYSDIRSSQPSDWGYGYTQAFSGPEQASALDFLAGPYSNNEFIHFSPSRSSPSSSSSGALAAVTAVAPKPGSAPTEDEVWNEYDDLIDYTLSPEKPKPNPPAEEENKFELATKASKTLQDELNSSDQLQSCLPAESARSSTSSVRLRRSKIMSALRASTIAPSSQPSYSDLIAGYAEHSDEHLNVPDISSHIEHSPSSEHLHEQQSTFLHSLAAAPPPAPAPSEEGRKTVPGCSERDWDAATRTNMRSASLMTSRWLSFGRVLFSPAHNHVKTGTHGRILVIDGLGNDDWSFYCSLTYPDAEVYSLSGRPVSTAMPHPAAWQPPTNHHTVYHMGLGNPLPFPKDYFTVAVLRFPAACSEAILSNMVQECKRVLRSGGYLEMSLLDRDMVNMGVRSRRAVRRLKEMTCLANPSVSLKPTSDNVQRLVGCQGFDNLQRCMVRIPVAGMVVRSSDSTTSSSNKSTTPSTAFSLPTISVTTTSGSQSKSPSEDVNISLGDLLSDPSPSPENDESIAKIVARVGRWWYTKCYEDPVLPDTGDGDPSMWNDHKVLRECQKRGTGFRMMIAYAQKPSEKRRTASV